MKIIYAIIALLLFISCHKKVQIREVIIDNSLFKTIVINPDDIDRKDIAKISEIADSTIYIPLETHDDILIGNMKKVLVWNNKFYIWDSMTETVFCFGQNGEFIHKISNRGGGPGEYPRISDFSIHTKTGDVYIYSDVGQAFYQYSGDDGRFLNKIPITLILSTFAIQRGDTFLCYCERSPNRYYFSPIFPEQFRYVVLHDNINLEQQLKYTFKESHLKAPLSQNNFSFYKDTVLLTEYMKPEVYGIDETYRLIPRYKIEFTTNTYNLSFKEDTNIEKMRNSENSGGLATLSSFYETDDYILMNYARKLYGFAYVAKNDNTIHNMGYFLFDDIQGIPMSISILYVDDEYLYTSTEPGLLLTQIKQLGKVKKSPYLENLATKIEEIDNPVIIKAKLKKL
jgi:hypothetical protein